MTRTTSSSAAERKPAASNASAKTSLPDAPLVLPAAVQNGTSRFDPIGRLEPSPGYTAAPPADLAEDIAYVEPRTSLNPAVVLPDDVDDEQTSSDAVRLSELPINFPRQHSTDGATVGATSLARNA